MKKIVAGIVGLWVAAGNAAAAAEGPLDGRWSLDAEFCTKEEATDAIPVVIEGNEIRYYESTCTITGMTPIGTASSAWRVAATCRGEGEEWQSDMILALDRDSQGTARQLVEIDMETGFVVVRQSCN